MPKFSTKDRFAIAALDENGLFDFISRQTLPGIGTNSRLLLSEIAQRLGASDDSVAIVVHRTHKGENSLYIWSTYNPAVVEAARLEPDRQWNAIVKANTFVVSNDDVERVLSFARHHYAKVLVLDDNGHRIENGLGKTEWLEKPAYDLLDKPVRVNLSAVVESLTALRPNDKAERIAIHGETDPDYRSLFGFGLSVDDKIKGLELSTRHERILFRLAVSDGRVRYLDYSTKDARPVEVLFGDSKDARKMMSLYKEAQKRHGHPLVEHDHDLLARLRLLQPRSGNEHTPL